MPFNFSCIVVSLELKVLWCQFSSLASMIDIKSWSYEVHFSYGMLRWALCWAPFSLITLLLMWWFHDRWLLLYGFPLSSLCMMKIEVIKPLEGRDLKQKTNPLAHNRKVTRWFWAKEMLYYLQAWSNISHYKRKMDLFRSLQILAL